MDVVTAKRSEAYERNRGEIDNLIDEIVVSVAAVENVNTERFTTTMHRVIDSIFYKRPSRDVIDFLNALAVYPPPVIYESVIRYQMYLVDKRSQKKHSTSYFLGFVRNCYYKFQEKEKKSQKKSKWKGPDDL
jgi:hypothetical protein